MTTFIDFNPSPTSAPPFQFQATLDGTVYSVTTTWNIFGARWYANIFALDGTRVGTRALVASPTGFQLQSLAWAAGEATVVAAAPHGLPIARSVALAVSGVTPEGYNGLFQCWVTTATTFTYELADDPGIATVVGAASRDINLVGGLASPAGTPFTSSLVYRGGRFEISP